MAVHIPFCGYYVCNSVMNNKNKAIEVLTFVQLVCTLASQFTYNDFCVLYCVLLLAVGMILVSVYTVLSFMDMPLNVYLQYCYDYYRCHLHQDTIDGK